MENTNGVSMKPIVSTYAMFVAAIMVAAPSASAQQITGTPGSPTATTTVDGRYVPNPPPKFGGVINMDAQNSKPYWPPRVVPPKGAPNVLAHHDGRPGLRHFEHLRRRDPDADAGPGCEGRASLYAVPLRLALLALASGTAHRTQPSRRGIRRDCRAGHRLSGIRRHHRAGERGHRRDPEAEWLRDFLVRQESQHAGLRIQFVGTLRSMAERNGLRIFLRLHGRRDRPVEAVAVPGSHADLSVGREPRLQPHHRHGGRRDTTHSRD